MKKLLLQLFKFGIVGASSTLIDYFLMIAFSEILNIHYLISCLLSFTISVIFNYICSMKFVFERKENINRKSEFALFVVLSIIGLGLNQLLMWLAVDALGIFYAVAKLFVTAIVMVYNFVTRKLLLEKKFFLS